MFWPMGHEQKHHIIFLGIVLKGCPFSALPSSFLKCRHNGWSWNTHLELWHRSHKWEWAKWQNLRRFHLSLSYLLLGFIPMRQNLYLHKLLGRRVLHPAAKTDPDWSPQSPHDDKMTGPTWIPALPLLIVWPCGIPLIVHLNFSLLPTSQVSNGDYNTSMWL
jgi:hypothetical protein